MQTFTLTEAVNNLARLHRELGEDQPEQAVLTTRHGRPVLALIEIRFLQDVLQAAATAFTMKDARSLMKLAAALAPLTNIRMAMTQTYVEVVLEQIQAALDGG
jgi:hypothetical protein